jgi:hypothetical protein
VKALRLILTQKTRQLFICRLIDLALGLALGSQVRPFIQYGALFDGDIARQFSMRHGGCQYGKVSGDIVDGVSARHGPISEFLELRIGDGGRFSLCPPAL